MVKTPLHAIVDVEAADRSQRLPLDVARAFLDGGARCIQLRAKTLPSGAFLELADACLRIALPYQADVIVNDRADIARLSGAAGVHVGQDDLTPAAARRLLAADAIVGLSTHTTSQIDAALAQPISYLAVGPVFGTRTKATGYDPVGLELVTAAVRRAGNVPVVAIGGITLDNAATVMQAGASVVAVIGDLLASGDAAGRVRAYLQDLARYRV